MIYFITDGEYTKIGYTDYDIEYRVKQLQTANARELNVAHSMEGDIETERWVHECLDHVRVRGEWFDLGESPNFQILDCHLRNYQFYKYREKYTPKKPKKRKMRRKNPII